MFDRILGNSIYRKYREMLLCILDLTVVAASFTVAVLSKAEFGLLRNKDVILLDMIRILPIVLLVYLLFFLVFKIQNSLWKYVGIKEVLRICASSACATIVLLIACLFGGHPGHDIGIYFTGSLLTIVIMLLIRSSYRLQRRKSADDKKKQNKRAIIVGAGDGGYLLMKELEQNSQFEGQLVGFIDDYKVGKIVSGLPVLGKINNIPEIVESKKISVIYIAMPSAGRERIRKICEIAQMTNAETKILRSEVLSKISEKLPIADVSIEDLLGRGEVKLNKEELRSYLEGKKVLVTGAAGSIGSELCRQIVKFKPKIIYMVDINENNLYMLEQEFNRDIVHGKMDETIQIYSYIANIREYSTILKLFQMCRPDVVYHAAAHKHVPLMETRPEEAVKNNVFGTNNVINACIKCEIPRFIMISTDKAVNPTNIMGATKRMTELILQSHQDNGVTKLAAVRFGNVLGSAGSVIPIFKKQIAEGGPVTLTSREIVRYFMTIPEAAQLVLQAGYYANKGEIFVLDMGEPVKILDLAENLIKLSGYRPYKDIDIKEIGLRPGEKMFEELKLDCENVKKTDNDLIFVNDRMSISHSFINNALEKMDVALRSDLENTEWKKLLLQVIHDERINNGSYII
ncbi:polysaccharide biosynthesis protein [Clostridiaceae bacterium DONG20-135]|uniref:Polysaccharide biosynthesis protein n=1 Tax=Copranaerobaculum intestinale TaxID=2692629 RepID=A0A6N8U7T1_9FIRM|nr:nucleoside-diphosphate sugar epimerase/dehydratase [Copranaerobaculum intestinale]MXQ72763.1 polysaccharide biosynthesis protein [Copranaerobaculum intestinale]